MHDRTERDAARRIATASDERRRQAERAMHDGVQQHLALLSLKLSLLRSRLPDDPAGAELLAAELSQNLISAQRELRELAHWVYPAVLQNEGLVAALRDAAVRLALPVRMELDGIGRFSDEIESTTYFCCLDALDIIHRLAGPDSSATVSLTQSDAHLRFLVAGDGTGAPLALDAAGLQHVEDRLAALGGSLEVTAGPRLTPRILGTIPLSAPGSGAPAC